MSYNGSNSEVEGESLLIEELFNFSIIFSVVGGSGGNLLGSSQASANSPCSLLTRVNNSIQGPGFFTCKPNVEPGVRSRSLFVPFPPVQALIREPHLPW